jgi:hypothetical protein
VDARQSRNKRANRRLSWVVTSSLAGNFFGRFFDRFFDRSFNRPSGAACRAAALALAFGLGLAGGASAQLQAVPGQVAPGFYFGGLESLSYDSNLTETDVAPRLSTWISNSSLIGGLNETYGRQNLTGTATIGRVIYHDQGDYDYTAEDVHLGWTSSLPGDINTDLDGGQTRQLAHFADFNTPTRNILTRDAINGSVDFPVYGQDFRGLVGGDGSKIRNSDPAEVINNSNSREVNVGLRYQPATGDRLDLLAREQHVDYTSPPSTASLTNANYTDRGIDLRATWVFSPISHILGRVGYTRRRVENPALSFENFSGPGFDVSYVYLPTPKTSLTLYALRQTGATGENGALYAITRTLRFTPAYLPTAKTKLTLNLEYDLYNNITTQSYANALTAYYLSVFPAGSTIPFIPNQSFSYHSTSVGLDGTWDPYRWLEAKLSWRRDERSAGDVALGFNYVERVTMVTVQAKFQ